ncbi:MAG: hypothetical protein J1E80_09975 [Desulfovibrionaceae bacterium]|nr:hypothetical protein [Desulfovibrionaceae bacterium]
MITTTAATVATLAATAISTGMGIYSSIQQGKAQAEQAKYQAAVSRQNQQLAEEQAGAERREGYEAMIEKRQEAARLIGRQRAAAGAGGAALDVGGSLELAADTAAQGEMDALNLYSAGLDRAYNTQLQARGYGQRAAAYDAQGASAKSAGYLNAASAAIGGIAEMGSTWGKYKAAQPSTDIRHWDRALGTYSKSIVRH